MPSHHVNLDALIKREDLQINATDADKPGGDVPAISLMELRHGRSMFEVLRKPDFQRETSEWTPEQIVELVKNTLDDELVPAVIVWKAPNRDIFVIDGAHRLSALMAWINDDYGSGPISQKFYGGIDAIPKGQILAAKFTQRIIEAEIGSFADLEKYRSMGGTPLQVKRAKNLASAHIIVQSVRNDASHAEASFYRINQGGARIDDTEKEIIHARRRPEAVATRALLRAGSGHQYWWEFTDDVRTQIEKLAANIYSTLYRPDIEEPIRTLELPMAGKGYSAEALAILFEFVHLANNLKRNVQKKSKGSATTLEPLPKDDAKRDPDGQLTIQYLKAVRDTVNMITSNQPESLGLHPAVYCYSATGKFQPTGFFAQVQLVQHLNARKAFTDFIPKRAQFEEFIVNYKYFLNQLISSYGANTRALKYLFDLYLLILDEIGNGKSNEDIKELVLATPPFSSRLKEINPGEKLSSQNFGKETKAAIRLRDALKNASRCYICKSRYHPNSNTIDHIVNVRNGGLGSMDNGGVAHPYCNTGYKEWCISHGRPLPV